MTLQNITMTLSPREGALPRTMLTMARRGWTIIRMSVERDRDSELRVDAQVMPTPKARAMDPHTLRAQLQRLHDVREVALQAPAKTVATGKVELRP